MFRHILFPTDGGAPSLAAVDACVRFARDAGARLTVLHVRAPFHFLALRESLAEESAGAYATHSQSLAHACVEQVAQAARAQGVVCATLVVEHELPYQAILDTARTQRCDLVAMASHGRSGLQALLIGSETQKLLAHSHLPVLVFR
jgi:nucleotide-binding universal stress UspA family protein